MLRYIAMFFTLMGALTCILFGMTEYDLARRCSAEPEEISLRNLIQRGPDGNPNVVLTDFALCEHYIYHKDDVWVPVVHVEADGTADTKPNAVWAFLFSNRGYSEKEMLEKFDRPKVRAIVDPHAERPGIWGSVLLGQHYPNTDVSRCLILVEGKEPAGPFKLSLYGLGSAGCLFLTVGIWLFARMWDRIEVPKPVYATRRST